MAFYDTADAIYGTGQYGVASYGIVSPNVSLTGVSATALTRTIHINAFEVDITEPLNVTPALTGSVGTLEFANTVTLTGVASTGQIGTVSPNIDVILVGIVPIPESLVGSPSINLSEKVTGVVGTFTLNAAGLDIRSVNRVPVSVSAITGSIGTVSPNVDEPIATGVQGTTASGSVQVNLSEKLDSVSATGGVGSLEHSNTVTLTGVEGVGQVGEVEDQPLERIATGVQATGAIGTLAFSNSFTIASVVGTFSIGTVTATGVTFNFVANDYDRKRVVYIPRQDTVAERRVAA